jgi:hypothetical protein
VWQFAELGGACVADPELADCNAMLDVRSLALTIVVGLTGAFIALFGHAFFVTQLFLDGSLLFAMFFYVGLSYASPPVLGAARLWGSAGGGIIGGLASV